MLIIDVIFGLFMILIIDVICRMDDTYSDFDWTWIDDSSCYGRSWTDTLPFSNFDIGPSDMGEDDLYTNEILFSIFDPSKFNYLIY